MEQRKELSISWKPWTRIAGGILLLQLASVHPSQWLFFVTVEKCTSFSHAICTWWYWTKKTSCHHLRERNCPQKVLLTYQLFYHSASSMGSLMGVLSMRKWTSINWMGTQRLNWPVPTVGRPATFWGCWSRTAVLELLLSTVYLFGGQMTPFSSAIKLVPFIGTKLALQHLWGIYRCGSSLKA